MAITEGGEGAPGAKPPEFDIGGAAFYLFKRGGELGWGGLIRIAVFYLAVITVLFLLVGWAYIEFFRGMTDPGFQETPSEVFAAMGPMLIAMPLYMLGMWVLYSMTDAALLRWLYGGGAHIRLDGAAGRLMVVALCWMLVMIAIYIPMVVPLAVGGAMESAGMLAIGVLMIFVMLGVLTFVAVRLAPAAALSIYRDKLDFFGAWGVTRGIGWKMLGVFVIIFAVYIGASMGLQLLLQPFMMAMMFGEMSNWEAMASGAEPSPEEVRMMLESLLAPGMIVLYLVAVLISLALAFAFQALAAGANAYAVQYAYSTHYKAALG